MMKTKAFQGANVFMSRNLVQPELFDALQDAVKDNGAQLHLCCDPSRNGPNDYHVISSRKHVILFNFSLPLSFSLFFFFFCWSVSLFHRRSSMILSPRDANCSVIFRFHFAITMSVQICVQLLIETYSNICICYTFSILGFRDGIYTHSLYITVLLCWFLYLKLLLLLVSFVSLLLLNTANGLVIFRFHFSITMCVWICLLLLIEIDSILMSVLDNSSSRFQWWYTHVCFCVGFDCWNWNWCCSWVIIVSSLLLNRSYMCSFVCQSTKASA